MSTVTHQVGRETIASYRREGWTMLPGVLSASELETVRGICRQVEETTAPGLTGQAEGSPGAAFAYHSDDRYKQMWSNSFDLRLQFPELMRLVGSIAQVPRALLGTDDVRVFWDKTFVKPPAQDGTRESVWHQDFPYNPIDRRGMLTVWIALEDVPAESGALRFVPRSHRLGPLGRLDLVSSDYGLEDILRDDDMDQVGEPVTVPLRAGDASVHDALTLHGAGPNLTQHPRRAWTIVYVPGSTLYLGGPHPHASINALGLQPYAPFDHEQFQVPASPG